MNLPSTSTQSFARFVWLFLICLLGLQPAAQAQNNIATWAFGVAGVAASPVDINVSGSNAVYVNAGATQALVGSNFNCDSWKFSPLDLGRYFEVTATPATNYNMTATQFSVAMRTGVTGPSNYEVRISTDGFSTSLSVGSGAMPTSASPTSISFTIGTVVRSTATLSVRVYFWGANNKGTDINIGRANISGTVQRPALTVTPSSLSGFLTTAGVASVAQTYILTGSNLVSAATLTAPAGYEISLSLLSGYGSTLSVPQSNGAISATTIYVRLTGATAGTFTGNITNAATGAITQNVALTGTVQPALPVSLVSFKGQAAANNVVLTWATASEQESAQFVVQRSNDASEFVSVGSRQAAGTTDRQQYYSLTDESPRSGINYYRLKQVDRDGSAVYSKAIAVRVDASQPYASLAENPTDGQAIQLRLYQMEAPQVRLNSLTGQNIAGQLSLRSNSEAVYTPASALAPGLYIITVQEGVVRQAMKVLVR